MKKILFFLGLMFSSATVFAQTMTLEYYGNDSVKLIINNKSIICDAGQTELFGILSSEKDSIVVTDVSITEKPRLSAAVTHKIDVNSNNIPLSNNDALLSENYNQKISNETKKMTLKHSSKLEVFRGEKVFGTFIIESWTKEFIKKRIEDSVVSDTVFSIDPNQSITIVVNDIPCPKGLEITNITMKIGDKAIDGIIGDKKVSFVVNNTIISDVNTIPIQLMISVYDDLNSVQYDDLLIDYAQIQKNNPTHTDPEEPFNILEWIQKHKNAMIWLLCAVLVAAIMGFVASLIIKQKKKNRFRLHSTDNGKIIVIFCQKEKDKPNAGDEVQTDKDGFVVTQEGCYAFDIKKVDKKKIIEKVYYIVHNGKNDPIYVDKDTLSSDGSTNSYEYILPDGTHINIVSGAKVKYTGEEQEIGGDRILKIETKEDGNYILITSKSDTGAAAPTNTPDDGLGQLKKKIEELESQISELKLRPTPEEYNSVQQKLQTAQQELQTAQQELQTVQQELQTVQQELQTAEAVIREYEGRLYILQNKNLELEKELGEAKEKITSLEKELDKEKGVSAILRKNAFKENVYYLYRIQHVFDDISNSIADVYRGMTNSKIKEGLISPIVKGVSGLSAGVLSWGEDYKTNVMSNISSFFGVDDASDVLQMKESDVKEKLAKGFVAVVVKSDGFSKLVRLYQLSTVPFIRKQFIESGMDIVALKQLYDKTFSLVSDFGFEIVCPGLFYEQYDEQNYSWYGSTNLFNYIALSEEDRKFVKSKGANVIIDVTQIGYVSQWGTRKATVVTPDF